MEAGVKRKREPDHPRITYHAPGRTFDRLFKEESLRDLKDVVRKKLHVSSSNDIKLVQLRGNTEIDLEDDDDFDAFFSAAHHTSILNVRVIVAKGPQSEPSAVSVENSAVEDSGRNKELPKSVVSESQDEPGNPGATEKKRKEKENQSESTPHSQAESEHENRVEETVSTSSKDVEPPAKKRRVSFAAGDSESKKRRKKGKDKDSTTSEQGATLLPALPDQDSSSRPESLQDIAGKDAAITSLAPDTEQNKKRKQTDVNMSIPEKLGPTTSSERALKPKRKKRRKAGTDTDEDQSNPAPAPTEASTTESSNPLKQAGTIEKPQPKQKRGVTDANKPSTFEAQLASAVVEASGGVKTQKLKKNKVNAAASEVSSEVTLAATPTAPNVREESLTVSPEVDSTEGKEVTKTKAGKGKKAKEASRMEKETASAQRRAALPQTILASVVSSLLKAKKGAAGSKSSTPQQTRNQDSPSNVAPNNTPTPIPNATSKTTTKSSRSTKTCPLCLQIPFHVRSKCPVTIGDVEAIKNRLSELQGATSGDGEHRTQIISKLQSIVDSKSKEGKPNNVNGIVVSSSSPATPSSNHSATDVVPTVVGAKKKVNGSSDARACGGEEISYSSNSESGAKRRKLSYPVIDLLIPEVDVSRYSEKELEELIYGPNRSISAANIPLPDSSDEESEKSEGVLEEEEEEEGYSRKYGHRTRYTHDSSSEENDEDEAEASEGIGQLMDSNPPVVQRVTDEEGQGDLEQEYDEYSKKYGRHARYTGDSSSEDGNDESEAQMSKGDGQAIDSKPAVVQRATDSILSQSPIEEDLTFGEVNGLGSSVEVDKSGDIAFSDALAQDNAVFHLGDSSNSTSRSTSIVVKSLDNEITTTDSGEAGNSLSINVGAADPLETRSGDAALPETIRHESIEPPDSPENPPTSPIESPGTDIITPAPKESTPKPEMMRRLASLGKRSMRMAPIFRPSLRSTQKEDAVTEETEMPGPRRSIRTAARNAGQSQPVAPLASQRSKRNLRGKDPAVELPADNVDISKSPKGPQASSRMVRAPTKQVEDVKGTIIKMPGKTRTAVVEPVAEENDTELRANNAAEAERARWETLKQSQSSEAEADATVMIDELHSSPSSTPAQLRRTLRKNMKGSESLSSTQSVPEDDESQDNPLFLSSESLIPFPYSQPADLERAGRRMNVSVSPNESEDEEEVEAEITKSRPTGSQYRRLTDIASQGTLFRRPNMAPTNFTTTEDEIAELYGGIRHESENSEESDSGSESDSGKEPSHIPKSRRAGAATK